jgi:hypothetical protein
MERLSDQKQDREMRGTRFVFGIVLLALAIGIWVYLWVPMPIGF